MPSLRRLLAVVAAAALVLSGGSMPAFSISEEEVERARQERDRAAAARAAALADLDEAVAVFEEITAELETLTYRMGRVRGQLDAYDQRARVLRSEVRDRAVEAYMNGGNERDPIARMFTPEVVQQSIIAREVMAMAAESGTASLDALMAVIADMDRLRDELATDTERAAQLRVESEAVVARMGELFEEAASRASEAQRDYTQASAALEERRRREEEERRRREAEARARRAAQNTSAARGVPMSVTPGFICPVGGPTSFIDSWHFPRPGGRLHKGTDMFAPRGTPLVAVGDGTVRLGWNVLGGITTWLYADHGVNYYYAHLDSHPSGLATGQRVVRGQVIGYVGDTGNAPPGAYHLHFGMYPGGLMAVNPYPTVRAVC